MLEVALAAIGGACGAAARYMVGLLYARYTGKVHLATLTVNLSGSFMLGVLFGLSVHRESLLLFVFLGTGVLGGFTTYSTVAMQSAVMIGERRYRTLRRYLTLTYAGGLLFGGAGLAAGFFLHVP